MTETGVEAAAGVPMSDTVATGPAAADAKMTAAANAPETGGSDAHALLRAPLETRRLRLRPVRPEDHRLLYRLAIDGEVTFHWRFRGTTPSFEEFERQLWPGVLCQFVVSPSGRTDVFGLVVAYQADLRHRFCHTGIVMRPALHRTGLGMEALLGLARYLFFGWDFRLLVLETAGHTMPTFASAVRLGLVTEEGRVRDQYFYGGRYWDGVTLVHRREHYEAFARGPLGRCLEPGRRVVRTH